MAVQVCLQVSTSCSVRRAARALRLPSVLRMALPHRRLHAYHKMEGRKRLTGLQLEVPRSNAPRLTWSRGFGGLETGKDSEVSRSNAPDGLGWPQLGQGYKYHSVHHTTSSSPRQPTLTSSAGADSTLKRRPGLSSRAPQRQRCSRPAGARGRACCWRREQQGGKLLQSSA